MKLEISNVSKAYGGHTVLRSVNLNIAGAQALVLLGPSGGGKSTLLRILAGLERMDEGTIRWEGEPMPVDEAGLRRHRTSVGTVFQAYNLFPHLTALENITLPLEKVHRWNREEAREAALSVLTRFRLEAHAWKKPAELSGGQKQRIAIARAVAIRPRLLLFDEPTSALDPEMTAEVLDLIRELKEEGREFVLVTHQMGFARQVADVAAFLADGRVVEAGPDLLSNPRDPAAQQFLSRVLSY